MGKTRKQIFLIILFIFLVILAVFVLPLIGRKSFSPLIWRHLFENGYPNIFILKERFWNTLLAVTAGGGLALAGLILQTLFRNPLASPFTLGIAGGASFGAVLTISIFPMSLSFSQWSGGCGITLGALLGAALAALFVFMLGWGRDLSSGTVLLAGIGVNFFFSGMILFLQYISEEGRTFRMIRWAMGEINLTNIWFLIPMIVIVMLSAVLLFFFSRDLDVFLIGEDRAVSLGVNLRFLRFFLFFVSSVLVGIIVSVCGPIGFIGLMSPHFARLLVGSEHRILVPASLVFGALFMAVCWTVARIIFYPDILPVGVVTSLIGGPFFIWLLLRGKNGYSDILK